MSESTPNVERPCPIVPNIGIAIIRPEPWSATKTAGGVYIPDKVNEKTVQNIGTIIAMGAVNDEGKAHPRYSVGDLVLVGRFMETQPDGPLGEQLYAVDHGHIIGKLTRAARTAEQAAKDTEAAARASQDLAKEQYEQAQIPAAERRQVSRLVLANGMPG